MSKPMIASKCNDCANLPKCDFGKADYPFCFRKKEVEKEKVVFT